MPSRASMPTTMRPGKRRAEPLAEIGVADGDRPDDRARGAGVEHGADGRLVAEPAADLHRHVDGAADARDDVGLHGRARACAVEVDDVEPARAVVPPAARHRDGVVAVDRSRARSRLR
jgi:hypothetical protein